MQWGERARLALSLDLPVLVRELWAEGLLLPPATHVTPSHVAVPPLCQVPLLLAVPGFPSSAGV